MKTSLTILSSVFLFALTPLPVLGQEVEASGAQPVAVEESTVAETHALIGALNEFRQERGLHLLKVDRALTARAAAVFPELINARGVVDVTALKKDFKAADVGVLRGVVTHRGEKSGAEFPKYWAKDAQWEELMAGDFTHMGAATAKRSDGKLVAFIYLIKK